MPRWFVPFYTAVVLIQGIHVGEHIIQLFQVYVLGIPDDFALGLLGYVIQFQGTEEWLHVVFNLAYVLSLYVILVPLRRLSPGHVPTWAFTTFAIAGVGLETWHMVEHGVIISNVIANGGCPCPGIGDVLLMTTDTILHFFYNALTYSAVVLPFFFLRRPPGRQVRRREPAAA